MTVMNPAPARGKRYRKTEKCQDTKPGSTVRAFNTQRPVSSQCRVMATTDGLLKGTAWFVRRDVDKRNLHPITEQGGINFSQTEEQIIQPVPVDIIGAIVHGGANGFAATTSLESYFCHGTFDSDNVIRQKLCDFWKSPEGAAILRARFGDVADDLKVFPTHVTRRSAPPDHLSLIHIDYPSSYDLKDLYSEWKTRWNGILPHDICNYRLKGVLTVWIAQKEVTNFPLCVATTSANNTVVYRVGGKKHSVGVYHDEDMQWHVCPRMKPFDAWIFDTQHTPHCAIDLGGDGSRVSVEVRCLFVTGSAV